MGTATGLRQYEFCRFGTPIPPRGLLLAGVKADARLAPTRGQHGHAQLGKGQRRIFGVAASPLSKVTIWSGLRRVSTWYNSARLGIEHDLSAAHYVDAPANQFCGRRQFVGRG